MVTHFRRPVLHFFLALSLFLQACAPAWSVQPTPEPVTLKVVVLPFLSFAPFFIAEEEGYFAEQGLKIEYVKLTGSEAAIPALAKGQVDVVGAAISTALLNAIASGENIKIVAGRFYLAADGCPFGAFLARRDLVEAGALKSPAQLKGRRVVVEQVASMDGYLTGKLLARDSLTLADVEIVDAPPPAQLEAFGKGTIDLTNAFEPWITRLVGTGHAVLWMPIQQVLPDFQAAFNVYGSSILEKNPDAGRRFMVAYLKAVWQYNGGKTERNLEILVTHTGLDREVLEKACWPSIRSDGNINVQSVLDFQEWAVEKGYLDSSVTEEQFWDPSFVEHANEVLDASSQ